MSIPERKPVSTDLVETPPAPQVGISPDDSGVFRRIQEETAQGTVEVLTQEQAFQLECDRAWEMYMKLRKENKNRREFLDGLSNPVRDFVLSKVLAETKRLTGFSN